MLPDLRLVERGATAVGQYPAAGSAAGPGRRVPIDPAAEQVVAARLDLVEPGCLGRAAGVEADDAVRRSSTHCRNCSAVVTWSSSMPPPRMVSADTSSRSHRARPVPAGPPPSRPAGCASAGTGSSAAHRWVKAVMTPRIRLENSRTCSRGAIRRTGAGRPRRSRRRGRGRRRKGHRDRVRRTAHLAASDISDSAARNRLRHSRTAWAGGTMSQASSRAPAAAATWPGGADPAQSGRRGQRASDGGPRRIIS